MAVHRPSGEEWMRSIEYRIEQILAKVNSRDALAADAIDGFVITGATVQTAPTGDRIILSGNTLQVFQGDVLQVRMRPGAGLEIRDASTGLMVPLSDQAFGVATFGRASASSLSAPVGATSNWELIASSAGFTTRTGRVRTSGTAEFTLTGYRCRMVMQVYLTAEDDTDPISSTIRNIAMNTDTSGMALQQTMSGGKVVTVPPGRYRCRARWQVVSGPGTNGAASGTITDISGDAAPS